MLALICGCEGQRLLDRERRFFRDAQPWGLILFGRNVADPEQVRALCADFRDAVGRADAPVLIDQEGGRVRRLRPPHWPAYPAAARLAEAGPEAATLAGRLIADDLRAVGVTIDCAPVLDVRAPGGHDVIGDRAFGAEPDTVATLGRAFADGLRAGGVMPIVKHMPGHGRAGVDSHHHLPVVDASREVLERVDFAPFRRLADLPAAMTAHVVYTALDPERPATTSPEIVSTVIRGFIGFAGLLFSDDLSMNALRGSLGERAAAARTAGCDILLHCNGVAAEAEAVAAEAAPLDDAVAAKVAAATRWVGPPDDFDRRHALERLDAALAPVS